MPALGRPPTTRRASWGGSCSGRYAALGVFEFVNNHDDVAADQALAAYDAVTRLVGRDFAAEAEAA